MYSLEKVNELDKIFLNKMDFYGFHGVLSEEAKLGQRFRVDVVAEVNLQAAGTSDDLENTVNYASIYEMCKEVVEEKRFKLIETVAETIATNLLTNFQKIERVTVKVTKPNPPIQGIYDSVAVEIVRERGHE